MELYLLRHGTAEDEAPTDAERRLTDEGREKCRLAAAGLAALNVSFDVVWTSPLIRARETAELVVPDRRAELHDTLANHPVEEVLAELVRLPAGATILLVGHEPQMSAILEHLLGMESGAVEMKKAALAHVTVSFHPDGVSAHVFLRALWPPRSLRLMGGAHD